MARQRKPKTVIELPDPAPHPHPEGCDCIPALPYIRVSRVGERKYLISPEIQMRSMDEWAIREGRRLLSPVCDINKSGTTFRKRSVDKIIEQIGQGQFFELVLWKWSRWARNKEESAIYARKVREAGGKVYSATEDFDLDTAVGQLNYEVVSAIDQYQSRVMSETWHNVHDIRREDGLPHGGRERFGYDYSEVLVDGERRTRYVLNSEASALKSAFISWLEGVSFNKISQELNSAGWVTMLGGTWTPQGVARMMDTGFAAGLIRERSDEMKKKVERKEVGANAIASYDIWRLGSHEAAISTEVWEAYKARRLSNMNIAPRAQRPAHALSAILFCALCKRRLSTKYAGAGRTHQWQCPFQKSFHPDVPVSVNNRLALIAIRDWMRSQFGGVLDTGPFIAEAERAKLEHASKSGSDERSAIKAAIKERENEISNLVEAVAQASVRVAGRFNSKIEQLDVEIEDLRKRLQQLTPKKYIEKDVSLLQELDSVWDSLPPAVHNAGLNKVVSRIEVQPRSSTSSRTTAADRLVPVGVWEDPGLEEWLQSRPA